MSTEPAPDPRNEECANCGHFAGRHDHGGGHCRHGYPHEITIRPWGPGPRRVLEIQWCPCERVELA